MEATSTELSITQKAAGKARALAAKEGRPDAYLRVRVTAGGCSGFSYRLGFEDAPEETDRVMEGYGLRVLVDPRSLPIIQGSTLEFDDALLGGGFRVLNPQATHECSCGESFSV
jgi:iron-sulfur cluster assembly accessory protein